MVDDAVASPDSKIIYVEQSASYKAVMKELEVINIFWDESLQNKINAGKTVREDCDAEWIVCVYTRSSTLGLNLLLLLLLLLFMYMSVVNL
jgi:hypothetical protein